MYLNRVTLIGFIGSDAERKAANATNITIFSLASKTSWENEAGSWESRTEWHRCVAFGKLADFAGTLTKGAHVTMEGELRSHEYQRELTVGTKKTTLTQRVWEIRVDSVLKLDRAAKRPVGRAHVRLRVLDRLQELDVRDLPLNLLRAQRVPVVVDLEVREDRLRVLKAGIDPEVRVAQLRRLIREYINYYHEDRIHDSLEKDTPNRRSVEQKSAANASVTSSPRLGGLHHRYSWEKVA